MNRLTLLRVRKPGLALTTFTLVLLAGIAPPAQACMSSPPPPFCAKNLVLAKAGPPAVFVPGGVAPVFAVPYTVYWNMTNVGMPALCPPPTGPAGTFPATVTLNVTCIGGPGLAAPVVTPINLSLGYNPGGITVTLPAGPPRFCTIAGRVDLGLADGMMLRARGDNVVCVVEPSPDDPSIPRLDLQTLTPEVQGNHPGDQGRFDYRLTNNDPSHSVTVDIDAELENVSRLPEMPGGAAGPPGTGVFSASDPIIGDNFPIGFDDDLTPAGCLFLPADPGNPALATASETVTLAPGEVHDFSLHTRAFGLCADGSCGEGRLVIDGTFANGDPAVSCTGLVHAVDTSVPPLYDWPGSGRVIQLQPLNPEALAMFGEPQPGNSVQMDNVIIPNKAIIGDSGAQLQPQLELFTNMNNERARFSYQLSLDQPIPPGEQGFFAWTNIFFSPSPTDFLHITGVKLTAPNGFEQLGPGAIVNVQRDSPGPGPTSVFDVMYQFSGFAVDIDSGNLVPIQIGSYTLDTDPKAQNQLHGFAQFDIPLPEGAIDYEFVVLNVDVRGYAHGVVDSDIDGTPDANDNCLIAQNGSSIPDAGGNVQLDTDGDGIGNRCDADIAPPTNDCVVNFQDLEAMKRAFFSTPVSTDWNPDADFDGNNSVNFVDLQLLQEQFFGPPGPSGIPNNCNTDA